MILIIKEEKFIKIRNIVIILFLISIIFVSINASSSAEITTYKWGTGGDVAKNNLIKKNIPDSRIVKEVIKAAKKGTPIIKFGGGDGPKTLFVSGVHGNELASQVAALKFINKLDKLEKEKRIKGTIYVIPFVSAKSTAKNARFFNGKNLNLVANKVGTPTNNIVKFAKNINIDAVADFHCTRPGGVPGKNIILGTVYPMNKSAEMAIAISKLTGYPYKNEYYAAKSYPGALEDNLNINKIPAITCEVKTPHGKIASGSVLASYNQMIAFLKYNKNI